MKPISTVEDLVSRIAGIQDRASTGIPSRTELVAELRALAQDLESSPKVAAKKATFEDFTDIFENVKRTIKSNLNDSAIDKAQPQLMQAVAKKNLVRDPKGFSEDLLYHAVKFEVVVDKEKATEVINQYQHDLK